MKEKDDEKVQDIEGVLDTKCNESECGKLELEP